MFPGSLELFNKQSSFTKISEKYRPESLRKAESKKKVIETSFWVALRRCSVHLAPLAVSIWILVLNLKGHYIGASFPTFISSETINILFLQVAAKFQELMVIASLTTIIFHLARQELLFGGGLPLGLVGSGFLSNFGYFFSKEFIGSLTYTTSSRLRKYGFLVILLAAGLTAALTGPSTATLIVPKTQIWKAGGTPFYLRGNSSDFWPHYLTADNLEDQPYCFGQDATNYGVCPSGGFRSLWDHFGQHSPFDFKETHPAYSKPMSGSLFSWPIDSPLSQVPPVYTLGDARSVDNSWAYTFLVQSHAATAIMMQQITTDWWNALLTANKWTTNDVDDRVAQTTVLNPLTQVRCSNPTNMSSDENNVIFPVLSADGWVWLPGTPTSINTLNATATDHLRFQWVHLPGAFGPSTIGAVFESAWASDNSSRVVLGCTVFSTYVNATLFTDEYSFWSGWYPWNIDFVHRDSGYLPAGEQDPSTKSIGLKVNDTWLNLLTPPTPPDGPGSYSWQPSTIESIMMTSGLQDLMISGNASSIAESWRTEDLTGSGKSMLLEAIICSVFVDGLSRSGSNKIYNTTGAVRDWTISGYEQKADFNKSVITGKDAFDPPTIASGNATKLRIDFNITGYVYEVSLAEYLAMTVLIVHIAFALSHTVWILYTRETSDSWDSMSSILALAQNSHSSIGVLKNASAGIDSFSTYTRMARIRAI